jgi:hypothetical protein
MQLMDDEMTRAGRCGDAAVRTWGAIGIGSTGWDHKMLSLQAWRA